MQLRTGLSTLAATLLVAMLTAPRVAAEPTPPAAPAVAPGAVVPPRPTAPLHADYPAAATGDAEVVLVVVVEADGSVRSARALVGEEPFASAAVAASAAWRFEPATREGKPIAASIRAQIRFTAPETELPAGPPVGTPPAGPSPKPSPPLEVTVKGDHPVGAQSLSRAEVRLLPGAFGDPFRAIDVLPGVTPIASGLPYFYVRGAPPGNVGYFIDGIRVPLLYHVALGPSVVHPAIIDRVDLYAGGYPASFGRYAGGIVSGETKEPPAGLHGEANIRLVDAGVMAEAPLKEIGKIPLLGGLDAAGGSFFAAGRYCYGGALLSLLSSVKLGYWDYQARLSVDVTPKDTLTIFAFGAHDFLGSEANGVLTTLFDTTFHRVDLRYDHRFGGPDDRIRQAITFGYDETDLGGGSYANDHLVASRTEITRRATDTIVVRAGLDAQLDVYHADLTNAFAGGPFGSVSTMITPNAPITPGATASAGGIPDVAALYSDRIGITMGARADAVIRVAPRFEVTPGVRFDFYESKGQSAVGVDPRLAARVEISKNLRLVTTNALASQPPSFVLPLPGFTQDLTGGLQRSWQTSLGVEADLPWDVDASVTVFGNAFFNMTDALGLPPVVTTTVANQPGMGVVTTSTSLPSFDARVDGSSYGVEVMLHRRLTRRLGGLVSYTLSRSQRTYPQGVVASAYDRTHVLNVAGTYDFGNGYRGGTRIVFYTGTPIDPTRPALGRIPSFGRFDFRFEKRWSIVSGRAWMSFVVEALNALAAQETVQEQCVSVTTPCQYGRIGPVTIPSIGIEGGF